MKLYIVDLDGVIADSAERFNRARRADGSTDWNIAFTPDLVELDTLIDGAKQALDNFADAADLVILLTSRPESMRDATEAWLSRHDLRYQQLAMKTKAHQYVKTVTWKANEVQRLIKLCELSGLVIDRVTFIDDEPGNRAAVEALGLENIEIKESLVKAKCSQCDLPATVTCSIGRCAPSTRYCAYHYEQTHLPENERD